MGKARHPCQGGLRAEAGSQVREAVKVTSVLEGGQMDNLGGPFSLGNLMSGDGS